MAARCLFVLASVMIALVPPQARAKGQPTSVHVIAAVPLVIPRALPNISPDEVLKGCGNHRYRDPTTHQCRSF
jgi:hypothetical protein